MELTRQLGEKLGEIRDQKIAEKIEQADAKRRRLREIDRNRRQIKAIKEQISNNIKSQKQSLYEQKRSIKKEIDKEYEKKRREQLSNDTEAYLKKSTITLSTFKQRRNLRMKKQREERQYHNKITKRYLTKIRSVEKEAKINHKRLHQLEKI
jgi:hypothetical protein